MQKIQRQWFPWTIATVAAAGLAFSIGTRPVAADEHERNPRIHHALDALYEAHDEIDHSHHMFHNHKREALDAIDHAIDRLEVIKDFEDLTSFLTFLLTNSGDIHLSPEFFC